MSKGRLDEKARFGMEDATEDAPPLAVEDIAAAARRNCSKRLGWACIEGCKAATRPSSSSLVDRGDTDGDEPLLDKSRG